MRNISLLIGFTLSLNFAYAQRIVSREIIFMPDEPKHTLTSKPQYPDSTWANTRIFNIDRLVDAYTHYPDDDSTIVGTGGKPWVLNSQLTPSIYNRMKQQITLSNLATIDPINIERKINQPILHISIGIKL